MRNGPKRSVHLLMQHLTSHSYLEVSFGGGSCCGLHRTLARCSRVVEASKAAVCSSRGVGSKSLPDGCGCRVVAAAVHPFDHQSAHSTCRL